MDADPELDVALSNGRSVVAFQITALDPGLGTWTVIATPRPRRVVLGQAEALAVRQQLDARIAARLAAGWDPSTLERRALRRGECRRISRSR